MVTGDLVKVEVSGLDSLSKKIDAARVVVKDLRPLWELFLSDFYKDQKRRFQLKGPGQYQDLSPAYKKRKQKLYGFLYPILVARGELAASLLSRNARGSVAVTEKQFMILGTRVRHAVYHHSKEPRTKIPRRPLWDENEDSPMLKRWNRMADRFFEKAMKGAFDGGTNRPGSVVAKGD